MVTARIGVGAALCFAALLLLAGCSKREAPARTAQQSTAGGSAAKSSSTVSGAGTITLKSVQQGGTSSTTAHGSSQSALTGHDRLLSLRGGSQVFPSDYAIGALQPSQPLGTETGEILHVIRRFFARLATGTIDTALVSPEWRDQLVRLLSYPKSKGDLPTSVRIGTLHVGQQEAHAAIRMEKGTGRAVGEIYLHRLKGSWYISDIQGDFAQLGQPFVRSKPFDPEEWKSLMKE